MDMDVDRLCWVLIVTDKWQLQFTNHNTSLCSKTETGSQNALQEELSDAAAREWYDPPEAKHFSVIPS